MNLPPVVQKLCRLTSWFLLALAAFSFLAIWFSPTNWQNPWQPVLLLLMGLLFRRLGGNAGKPANQPLP